MTDAQIELSQRFPRVHVIDTLQLLCVDRVCPPVIDGLPVYIDGVHFAEEFRLSLAYAVGAVITKELPILRPMIRTG